MWKLPLFILLLGVWPIFGQLESHTLAISATRSINLPPDQAVFDLTVNSSASTTSDQVVAALSGAGITSADLTGVQNTNAGILQWGFTLTAPIASLTSTIVALTKLEQTIAQNNSGLALTFSVNGTQVSQQLQQSQACSNADLIADATAQAQKLATAAGMALGPILKLSNAPSTSTSRLLEDFAGAEIVGDFSLAVRPAIAPQPVTCSLLVKFQLLL